MAVQTSRTSLWLRGWRGCSSRTWRERDNNRRRGAPRHGDDGPLPPPLRDRERNAIWLLGAVQHNSSGRRDDGSSARQWLLGVVAPLARGCHCRSRRTRVSSSGSLCLEVSSLPVFHLFSPLGPFLPPHRCPPRRREGSGPPTHSSV
jgi:hypothetical protein